MADNQAVNRNQASPPFVASPATVYAVEVPDGDDVMEAISRFMATVIPMPVHIQIMQAHGDLSRLVLRHLTTGENMTPMEGNYQISSFTGYIRLPEAENSRPYPSIIGYVDSLDGVSNFGELGTGPNLMVAKGIVY